MTEKEEQVTEKKKWTSSILRYEVLLVIATFLLAVIGSYGAYVSHKAAKVAVNAAYRVEQTQEKFSSDTRKLSVLNTTLYSMISKMALLKGKNVQLMNSIKKYTGENRSARIEKINNVRVSLLASLIADNDKLDTQNRSVLKNKDITNLYNNIRCLVLWNGELDKRILEKNYNFVFTIRGCASKTNKNNCNVPIKSSNDLLTRNRCIRNKITHILAKYHKLLTSMKMKLRAENSGFREKYLNL